RSLPYRRRRPPPAAPRHRRALPRRALPRRALPRRALPNRALPNRALPNPALANRALPNGRRPLGRSRGSARPRPPPSALQSAGQRHRSVPRSTPYRAAGATPDRAPERWRLAGLCAPGCLPAANVTEVNTVSPPVPSSAPPHRRSLPPQLAAAAVFFSSGAVLVLEIVGLRSEERRVGQERRSSGR